MRKLIEWIHKLSLRLILIVILGLFSSVCFAQLAAPDVSVEIVTIDEVDYVRLRWEAVEGAASYNIYASETATPEDWGDPIATVAADIIEYDVPVGGEKIKFFYVTASEMILVQGTEGVDFGSTQGEGYFNPGGRGGEDYHVSLSSFYISKYEVTQSEWTEVMGGIYDPDWTDVGQGPNHPAYRVTWFDAIEYCNRRSLMEGLEPCYSYLDYGTNPDNWPAGWNEDDDNHTNVSCNWEANGYRLPTEMEREFAARGGVPAQNAGTFNDRWAGTDVEAELGDYAWYIDNAGWGLPGGPDHPDYGTHPVGTKLPNELGLYDMSGNVSNWVWDMIWGWSYPTGSYNDPTGPETGDRRVLRGGSWGVHANSCYVDSPRNHNNATYRYRNYGFRVSRTLN